MNMALQIRNMTRGASILFPLEPHLDESIRGYLARTAEWNCFDSRSDLLRLAGITYVRRDLSDRIAAEITAVSGLLGLRSGKLRRILNPMIDGNAEVVDYFGMPFQRRRLEIKNRRISPASLRVSAHHRARWQIRLLPFCPESWEYLIDTCPSENCGKPLRWGDCLEVDRCEHCEYDLKEASAPCVPADLRASLSFVGNLLHPAADVRAGAVAQLPEPLNEVSPSEVFDLLCVLTRSLTPNHLKATSRPLEASYLASAAQALLDFPRTFDKLASETRGGADRAPPLFIRLRRRAKEKSSLQRALILSMADRAETVHRGPGRSAKNMEEQGEWTFHRSATWLGIKLSEFQEIIAAGLATPSPRRGHIPDLRWISPDEVRALGISLRRWMSPSEFVQSYGLPLAGVEQLVSLGLLEGCAEPVVRLLYPDFQLDRVSALRFVHGIADCFSDPSPDGVALEDVFHGIGGQEKPWGALLHAALEGQIPGGLGIEYDANLRFERLTVSHDFARDLLAGRYPQLLCLPSRSEALGPRPDFNRIEVLRYLNCYPRDLEWLLGQGLLERKAYGQRIHRQQVEELGRRLISDREIHWRWRISPERREVLLSLRGAVRVVGPFWPRDLVEEALSMHCGQRDIGGQGGHRLLQNSKPCFQLRG